jgi:gamma-glutamyltranspeptidase/glutathione hydrolase
VKPQSARHVNNGFALEAGMRDFQSPGRSPVYALNGMAATSHPLATLAAVDTLRAGGTAADAAVTAAALLGVIEPQSTGIGGDAFALYAPNGSDRVIAYNGSGRAPMRARAEWYLDQGIHQIPLTGPHSVTVPGAVDLWATLLSAHGRRGLDTALQPAIRAAAEGFPVAPRTAWDWARNVEKLRRGVNSKALFLPKDRAPAVGDIVRQPQLAETLRSIAAHGRDGFYRGHVAEDIVATLRVAGGLHDLADFAGNATEVVSPISTRYRDHEIWQCPPNGPGVTVLMMLNVLEPYDLSVYAPLSVERLHLEAEAARHAYLARERHTGDPRFVEVDVARLLSPAFSEAMRRQIALDRVSDLPRAGVPMHPSTVYLSVVDRDRNACSLVTSVAYAFGSAIVSAKTGVLLQNRGAGFRIEPGHPNCIAPGKRPLHTLLAGLGTRGGRAVMPFGVMGGQFQPTGQVHLLTNVLDYDMDVQQALDLPRGFHYDGVYQLETGISDEVMSRLEQLGHAVARPSEPHGGGQAIWIDWDHGVLVGGSDARKDGCALGY